ncbi:shikimate kinase [Marinicella sediminis]|uniref:Shikimate kinase n=1 Tax=Marinicella sediminis TaxID=1792834 RepID=A0ABV7JEJ0_9GAMM|nr:shikimate kinase [Marinicella sediminis]
MVNKIIIFGNSGSGKSTLANRLKQQQNLAHLDLDTLAWEATNPPVRRPQEASVKDIQAFIMQHPKWIIEGCYTDLLNLIAPLAELAVFMNLPVAMCQANARKRPWEPHKYVSQEAQDENLPMLLNWIAEYDQRTDEFSLQAHKKLFESFHGDKIRHRENPASG